MWCDNKEKQVKIALEKRLFRQLITYMSLGGSVGMITSEKERGKEEERKRERGGERLLLLTCQG